MTDGCHDDLFNGNLTGDVYMVQSERFVDPLGANKVCKL